MANEQLIEKIRKLIAHAEGTKNVEEAANYWAKAQELMTKWAIDEAVVRSQKKVRGEAKNLRIEDVGIKDFRYNKTMLLNTVALTNRCRLIDCRTHYQLVGMENDVNFVNLLWTSLVLEGWQMMLADRRNDPEGRARPNVYAGNWLEAFTYRVGARLREANKTVEEGYKAVAGDPNTVAIVLKDVRLAVDEKVQELFPHLRNGRAGGSRSYIGSAREAGRRAGDKADISGGANRLRSRPQLP